MKLGNLWLSVALLLLTGAGYAGFTQPASVDVDLTNNFAGGDQLTARTSDDPDVFIGCGVRIFDTNQQPFYWGFCQAEDSEGESIQCFTQSADLLEAMRSTSAYAYITFSWDSSTLECTRVGFSTQSFYLPDPNLKAKEKDE